MIFWKDYSYSPIDILKYYIYNTALHSHILCETVGDTVTSSVELFFLQATRSVR